MILALLLAAQAAATPADLLQTEDPPIEMIDFLGRRRVCAEQREEGGETSPWLHCANLPDEEREWRARSAGNAIALAWLDQDPRRFHLK